MPIHKNSHKICELLIGYLNSERFIYKDDAININCGYGFFRETTLYHIFLTLNIPIVCLRREYERRYTSESSPFRGDDTFYKNKKNKWVLIKADVFLVFNINWVTHTPPEWDNA